MLFLKPILIAGPTASGKSGLALEVAQEFDGEIINADASQVYQELEIVTARPSKVELSLIAHRLYGHVSGEQAYSVGAWLKDIACELKRLERAQKRAIIVGGTGLYFQALLEGLAVVPDIDPEIRKFWRKKAESEAVGELYEMLETKDPLMASQVVATDHQRIVRALEVIESTGKSLKFWQSRMEPALLPLEQTCPIVIMDKREALYDRINQRFREMVEKGAVDEVRRLVDLNYSAALPIMRAIGVPELCCYIEGTLSLDEAIDKASQQSRRYAKRQFTWLRRNMIAWNRVNAQEMKRNLPKIFSIIHDCG